MTMERQVRRPWLILTDEEVRKLESALHLPYLYLNNPAGEFARKRDLTILRLMRTVGLRPGECYNLRWEQIDFENNLIYINPYHNKQRDGETAKLHEYSRNLLLDWKYYLNTVIITPYLFPMLQTLEPPTTSFMAKRFNMLAKAAGIHRVIGFTRSGQPISNIRPYTYRKVFGNTVIHTTNNPIITMKALRQHRISSIMPYVSCTDEELTNALNYVFGSLNDI